LSPTTELIFRVEALKMETAGLFFPEKLVSTYDYTRVRTQKINTLILTAVRTSNHIVNNLHGYEIT
jgi:hypothetical protein